MEARITVIRGEREVTSVLVGRRAGLIRLGVAGIIVIGVIRILEERERSDLTGRWEGVLYSGGEEGIEFCGVRGRAGINVLEEIMEGA